MSGRYRLQTFTARGAVITGVALLTTVLIIGGAYMTVRGQNSANIIPIMKSANQFSAGWNYMPGTSASTKGLYVRQLGRTIVNQDGSGGQPNPPVNLYGSYFRVLGDFEILMTMRDISGAAVVQFYDRPPIIQDEFRVESKSVRITAHGNQVSVTRWNGYNGEPLSSQGPVAGEQRTLAERSVNKLTFVRHKGRVDVRLNDVHITSFDESGLFDSGTLWVGADAMSPGASWTLADLKINGDIRAENAQSKEAITKQQDGLQQLAQARRPDFTIGSAVALGPLVADDTYAELVFGGNFGQLTTENALKWQFIHPQPDIYDFQEADAMVALAQKNGMRVHGHTLVFGEANPQWVQRLPVATDVDKEQVRRVMKEHVTKTISHFRGKIGSWDVVNEPLNEDGTGLRQHIWYQAMGEDYIKTALMAAQEADPHAKLYINEYGLEEDGERWDTFLSLVKRLKSQGAPLDGVGLQAHVYDMETDAIDPTVLRAHIRALADLGLSVRISEMDVDASAGAEVQARQYADVLATCFAEASCVSWSTWGVTDVYNMWQSDDRKLQYGQDFLWDSQYHPKLAIDRMSTALRDK